MSRARNLSICLFMTAAMFFSNLAAQVRVYEEPLNIPTYKLGDPEIMPIWRDRVYPYTMLDKITDNKVDRTYRALWVENEYVKALVLPEIGGRLHGAEDKTNGYQFLYDQKVIKPGLVGMTGAWISGGVEWNFPDGHRASGFRDTDYRITENPDGSKTAWTGEIDRITGMRWSVGTTVHPGRNWVETKVRLYNSTPYMHNFQWWATSAVRATYEYQAIIPGEIVTGHGNHEFFHWPIDKGVDISKWKNLPGHTSFFAWQSQEDYFGGWSPEEKAGLVHVADHHIVRGKKLWSWGTAPAGRIWEQILTDGDLPYFEPQAGGYSDNQPDLHWIRPGETKIFTHFWFPVRDIGAWDFANLEGAISLKLDRNKVRFGWSPTGANNNAKVAVLSGGNEIFGKVLNADPATPVVAEVNAPRGAELYDLRMLVISAGGDTLISFSHPRPKNPELPEPAARPAPPEQIKNQDELFLLGDHLIKFRNRQRGILYFEEALRRDPGDVRVNTAMGLLMLKEGKFDQAIEHLDRALERSEVQYDAQYYKGLAFLHLGRAAEAERSLNRSSYDYANYAPAHFELAQLTAADGRWERALEHIDRSIGANGDNTQAWAVKALILNRLGRHREALEVAEKVQQVDPLDFLSLAVKGLTLRDLGRSSEVEAVYAQALKLLRDDPYNHIELAIRFARCGLHDLAVMVMSRVAERASDNPLALYFNAWYNHKAGNEAQAESLLKLATRAPYDYVFPIRLETFPVLRYALEKNPGDGLASYFLGNLYYGLNNPDKAIPAWEKAVTGDPKNFVAWRNIGFARARKHELEPARAAYEKAVEVDARAAVLALDELVQLMIDMKAPSNERLALMEKYKEAVESRGHVLKSYISLLVQTGRHTDALAYLKNRHFKSWEGRYDIHQYWVESNLQLGDQAMEAGDRKKALEHYQLALTYPENLEVAELPNTVHANKWYRVGLAHEALGDRRKAREAWGKVVEQEEIMRDDSAFRYYLGKAREKLGQKDEARKVYQNLLAAVEKGGGGRHVEEFEDEDAPNFDQRRNPAAINDFKRALALEGLGRDDEARALREKATRLDPIVALRAFSPPRAGW